MTTVDVTRLTVSADDGVAKELGLGVKKNELDSPPRQQQCLPSQNHDPAVLSFSNDRAKRKYGESLRVHWTKRDPLIARIAVRCLPLERKYEEGQTQHF